RHRGPLPPRTRCDPWRDQRARRLRGHHCGQMRTGLGSIPRFRGDPAMRHARLLLLPAALMLAACQPQAPVEDPAATPTPDATAATAPPVEADPGAMPEGMAAAPGAVSATARLQATEGNQVAGTLSFAPVDGGIRVTGEVTGLPGGSEHGFHVHENGDCSAPDGSSAGGHFNPAATAH